MHKLSEITDYLKDEGLNLSGPIARQDGDKSTLYAFIEVSRDINGHQKPSNLSLGRISKKILDSGVTIKFILNDITNIDLESGLRATLLHAYPDCVRNSFLTIEPTGATAWLVPKSAAIRSHLDKINERISVYLKNANLSLAAVRLTVDENLPSRTAILSELRIAAPASVENLVVKLTGKGFTKPPVDYVNRHLDALRRAEQIIRRKDGKYCLTASSLKVLGTVKRRSSPDIVRFLDLAKRGGL